MADFLKDFTRNFSEALNPWQRDERHTAEDRAYQEAQLENKKNELMKQRVMEEDPSSPFNQEAQKSYKNALRAGAKILNVPVNVDAIDLSKHRAKDLEQLNQFDLLKEAARNQAVANKPAKAAPETPFNKTFDMETAKTFVKEVNSLPDIQNRTKNLDNIEKIADKVMTGPIAGRDNIFLAQKVTKDDAQRLEQFLSQENVKLMMEYAKQAGVRSVDTEQEQQRLFKSIANKELSPTVLKETVVRMRNMMKQAMELTRAKQKHYSQEGNLRSFSPDSVIAPQESPPQAGWTPEKEARLQELRAKAGK